MSGINDFHPTVVRTNRGLSVAGTRITLYQIMDYIKADEPPEVILSDFRLTIKQTADVLDYIKIHQDEIEKEYNDILIKAEKSRQYWSERNRQRFSQIAALPPKPEHKEIRNKLNEWKKRLTEHDRHTH